jgi:tRNA/tmRNA/rRNA uracil-C5-methylase (TrmA/RlmC/RlmD family)
MARDLQKLEGKFTIDKIILVDLFPSTYHFETVACLSFK